MSDNEDIIGGFIQSAYNKSDSSVYDTTSPLHSQSPLLSGTGSPILDVSDTSVVAYLPPDYEASLTQPEPYTSTPRCSNPPKKKKAKKGFKSAWEEPHEPVEIPPEPASITIYPKKWEVFTSKRKSASNAATMRNKIHKFNVKPTGYHERAGLLDMNTPLEEVCLCIDLVVCISN